MKYNQTLLTSEEFEEGVKEVWKRVEHLLYPNTPIEIIVDETGQHRVSGTNYHFSIFVEGSWRGKALTVKDAVNDIRNIVKVDAFSWESEGLRLRPQWSKWEHVSKASLLRLCKLEG